MSRFFATSYDYDSGSSSSEEELLSASEESLLSSSSEEEIAESSDDSEFFNDEEESESDFDSDDSDAKPYGPDWFKKQEFRKGPANKFLKRRNAGLSSDDDFSDDESNKKVVKSAKEKLLDELRASSSKIDIAELTNDWSIILNEFDTVAKLIVRSKQQNFGTPNIYVKIIAQITDAVNNAESTEFENKITAKAFNTTKQRVKKSAREIEDLLTKYKEDPDSFENELDQDIKGQSSFNTPELDNFVINAKKPGALSSIVTASVEAGFFPSLQIVLESRGKKNVDQTQLIESMEHLLSIASTTYEKIVAYLTLIPIRFDASSNFSYQPLESWKKSFNDIESLLYLLDENLDKFAVTEFTSVNDSIETQPEANAEGVVQVLGSLFSFVERLDDEFNKSLLNTDPHSSDYLQRLKDEQHVYNLILKIQVYFEKTLTAKTDEEKEAYLARVFVRRLDHIYYKANSLIAVMESKAWDYVPKVYDSKYVKFEGEATNAYLSSLIKTLSESLTKQEGSNTSLSKRGVLYQVYYTALNEEFSSAKEMLLESKIQSFINKSDPSLQILFNRVVVQLGLSAFKNWSIEECHQILNDLLAASHLREILGQQSLQRMASTGNSTTADDREKLCLPFHEHINIDLIDVVFLTCSLLIEIPQMTAFYSGIKIKKIPFSQKSIRRSLEHYDKSSLQGPPETSRDYILNAAKAMQRGSWKESFEYLNSIKAWKLLPNSEQVLKSLAASVQVESLKTYFFTNKRFYNEISIEKLSNLFDLSSEKVAETLQQVIDEYSIEASIDEEKTLITINKCDEITKLEEVASKLNKEIKIAKEHLRPNRGRR
ncbi:hypothetical protein TPHA_0L02320 [Tetrapisispora phaffii CBS 4417]|uniref:PCI domain-containing protein n=1 Tax=Tetrapisispora phaffii (strain ATCC 24235 / CBS 4417 / NBRC 1672 / NRRL Y-8282 / UCD 70-5) TaxID=1071381 RepID=G8C0A5_TETPH|nr:hypothetical protein TPHA_0L02320 [Tetrapisispora phaffii CBS 4417]CCE65583.1 hypothetical protein TPHA_0L02320 [Tetrapisispora phaffii CBS 4417]